MSEQPHEADTEDAPFLINLDAARAQREEAAGAGYKVQLCGAFFTFPGVSEWPVQITVLLKDGDLVGALKMLLPEADHERFFRHTPTMGDLQELFDALGKIAGVGGRGNSPRSVRSSPSRRKP